MTDRPSRLHGTTALFNTNLTPRDIQIGDTILTHRQLYTVTSWGPPAPGRKRRRLRVTARCLRCKKKFTQLISLQMFREELFCNDHREP